MQGYVVLNGYDPKDTAKATQEFLKVKKWDVLGWPSQSPNLRSTEHA